MTTQPTQHQPPGIEATIAGMLPAGAKSRIERNLLRDRQAVILTITHYEFGIEYWTEVGHWVVETTSIPNPYFMSVDDARQYATYLQAAADICDWLNEHWNPE